MRAPPVLRPAPTAAELLPPRAMPGSGGVPASSRRGHSAAQASGSIFSCTRNRRDQMIQLTSAAQSRARVNRSYSVQAVRGTSSNASSGGRGPFATTWLMPATNASAHCRVAAGRVAMVASTVRPKSNRRSARSSSIPSGPITSDTRPWAARRIASICAPRRCACTMPSAVARSASFSAQIYGTWCSFQRISTGACSGASASGSIARRSCMLVLGGSRRSARSSSGASCA